MLLKYKLKMRPGDVSETGGLLEDNKQKIPNTQKCIKFQTANKPSLNREHKMQFYKFIKREYTLYKRLLYSGFIEWDIFPRNPY